MGTMLSLGRFVAPRPLVTAPGRGVSIVRGGHKAVNHGSANVQASKACQNLPPPLSG